MSCNVLLRKSNCIFRVKDILKKNIFLISFNPSRAFSQEDSEKEDAELIKNSFKSLLSFTSDSNRGVTSINSDESGFSHDKPSIVKVPILESMEHILPHCERFVIMNDSIQSLTQFIDPGMQSIGMFIKKSLYETSDTYSHLYDTGTLMSYDTWPSMPGISSNIIMRGHQRLKKINIFQDNQYKIPFAECLLMPEPPLPSNYDKIKELCFKSMHFVRLLKNSIPNSHAEELLGRQILDPIYWSNCACEYTSQVSTDILQELLETEDVIERLKKNIELLSVEFGFVSFAAHFINKIREADVRENHAQHLIRLRSIIDRNITGTHPMSGQRIEDIFKGHNKANNSFERKIKERIKHLIFPESVKEVFDEEYQRLTTTDRSNTEYSVIQNYLDHLTRVPFGIYKGSNNSLDEAKKILDEDHFGLEDVKNTILEHLVVSTRADKLKGRILCLVGPPGVGKTSIVKSIARALNREYVRISVGGVDDTAEIKGHRRTYVASFPGKIIKALQTAQCMDPVVCVDEIDKLTHNMRGDPTGPLLEAFDPQQNFGFTDNYLEVPVDLSKVMFICTANTTSTISRPLLDRMEIVRLSGYTCDEKTAIVNNYLIPTIVKNFNISDIYKKSINVDENVILRLTNEYFIEAGVRKLNNCIETMFRKALKELHMDSSNSVHITLDNMSNYAGHPDNRIRPLREKQICGIVTGLTAIEGYSVGLTMDIECALSQNSTKKAGSVIVTGLAGKSLSESSSVAVIVARKTLLEIQPNNTSLENNDILIHFLEGGVKKDGPSAGSAIFCAVLSQALNIPVPHDIAMTGEITLKGKITDVGGIKEKMCAALRSGIYKIILPRGNEVQYSQVNESIKSKLSVTFVDNITELINSVFPEIEYPPIPQQMISTDAINSAQNTI